MRANVLPQDATFAPVALVPGSGKADRFGLFRYHTSGSTDHRMKQTEQTSRPDVLLGWMGSLADSTRLRLLRVLERHELGVVELCDVLQMPQSTVSRHLKVLADEKWVSSRRQGTA